MAVPLEHSFTRASDASPSWLGLPALAGCGSLPQSVWLRYSPSQLLMQARRSDLCSRHQHGSAGHSACFVICVTQLCRISQVRRRLARDAGLVALAAAHSSSNLQLTNTTWMTRVLGHAAWVCVCQIASQQLKRPSCTPALKSIRVELFVCNCVLAIADNYGPYRLGVSDFGGYASCTRLSATRWLTTPTNTALPPRSRQQKLRYSTGAVDTGHKGLMPGVTRDSRR